MTVYAYNPPKKSVPKGLQHCEAMLAPSGPESLRDGFFGGGLKGNCQKKYTMEVKTVKARKSDKVVSKRGKSATIWNQTLIVRNSG